MRTGFIAALSCLLIGEAACLPTAVGSRGTQHVHASENARVSGRFIPAGRQLSVRIEQPLDTAMTPRGTTFTAIVLQPVTDSTGAVLIAAGARLYGHLSSVSGATGERLRLRFEHIDTVLGQLPIDVRVDGAQYATYPGAPRIYSSGPYYGAYGMYPYGGGPMYGAWGDGWGYYGYDVYIPREVHLPAGAVMNLTLTRPLLAPGAVLSGK